MLCLYTGEALGAYGFGEGHPFGPDRHDVFMQECRKQGLDQHPDIRLCPPVDSDVATIGLFHTQEYIATVQEKSKTGQGYLDFGDTPAFVGVFERASTVVGCVVQAVDKIMAGECQHAFVPIAGLHHARRDMASGFCVFNDIGVAIEYLRAKHKVQRIAYVDIDAHHGDGVFYAFEADPELCFVDFHEDGRFLYPGTGAWEETGKGDAAGCKFNIPLPPGADDAQFDKYWDDAEAFIEKSQPEFIILQAGADSIEGDPITDLRLSPQTHAKVTERLKKLAYKYCDGRILALGGGGYNRQNLAQAWCAVVAQLLH